MQGAGFETRFAKGCRGLEFRVGGLELGCRVQNRGVQRVQGLELRAWGLECMVQGMELWHTKAGTVWILGCRAQSVGFRV
jgi:hypothetical protein